MSTTYGATPHNFVIECLNAWKITSALFFNFHPVLDLCVGMLPSKGWISRKFEDFNWIFYQLSHCDCEGELSIILRQNNSFNR
jgi:hypothetical protein